AGKVYGSIEESFLAAMTSPVINLLNIPKTNGALKVEAVTAPGVRTTLASSNYTLNVTNQTLSLTSTWFNANKSSYQKVVVSYETVQPVLNASGKPTLIDGQVAVFKTLFQQKYLQ